MVKYKPLCPYLDMKIAVLMYDIFGNFFKYALPWLCILPWSALSV